MGSVFIYLINERSVKRIEMENVRLTIGVNRSDRSRSHWCAGQ